jgi:16S rRNA (guanine1516-N2)-methyltransferase
MISNNQVAVVGATVQLTQLATSLQLPLLAEHDNNYEFLLMEHAGMLTLCWQAAKQPVFLAIDFLHGQLAYRQKQSLQKEAVVKAVGAKGKERPSVLDATAGLGRDAFILASIGCPVTLIEQNAVIAALLEDGIRRLLQQQALNMQLIKGDAIVKMASLLIKPDVVYLDPMFPPRNKTALVKKDMQILQRLTHDAPDNNEALFQTALDCATKRVVVKRPNYAPTITEQAADFVIRTEYHRFDIYKKM